MIDKYKQYQTKGGKEVKIYEILSREEGGKWRVHGSIMGIEGVFFTCRWSEDGIFLGGRDNDLIEVPRKTVRYFNVYHNGDVQGPYTSEERANSMKSFKRTRVELKKVEFEY